MWVSDEACYHTSIHEACSDYKDGRSEKGSSIYIIYIFKRKIKQNNFPRNLRFAHAKIFQLCEATDHIHLFVLSIEQVAKHSP